MRYQRIENTKRNIIIGEIDKISGILFPFIIRTMILHVMGAEYLGLTGLFYSVLQMLNLMEMGFGSAIIYSLYKPIAESDIKKVRALLSFYSKVYKICGISVAVTGLGMMYFLPFLIRGTIPEDVNLYGLYIIYLSNSCVNFFIYPNKKALLTAFQRDDVGGMIHIFTQLFMYIAQGCFVILSRNYYLYALMLPLSSVVYSVLCGRRVKKMYPQYEGREKLKKEDYKEIKKQVIGLMIRKTAMLSRNAFDSIFVSAYLGLKVTAIYANYYYIMDSVVMVLAVIKTSMAGGVGNSIATETIEKNLKDMHKINFLFMWISGFCSICLLCLYQPFMTLWAGETMVLEMKMAVLFSIYFYILKMSDIRTLYSESAGIWWQARYLSIVEALANLIMNWLFIGHLGLRGIILATMISYFVFNFLGGAKILFQNYFIKGGFLTYLYSHLKYAAVTAMTGCVTFYAVSFIKLEKVWELLIKALVCMVLPNVLYFLIYYHTEDFQNMKVWLLSICKRKKG